MMNKPTKEQLEILIKECKLEYISRPHGDFIVYRSDTHEFWDTKEKDISKGISMYRIEGGNAVGLIESEVLRDYHNLPAQKMKRLLDGME